MSQDCRYLVVLNEFGDGRYQCGGDLDWGLKFYDFGKEIRSYNVAALVDFPALMPETSADWHIRWFGEEEDSCKIEGSHFFFETSTHEYYRFDLATGEILEQRRPWRGVARIASALLAIATFAMVAFARAKTPGSRMLQSIEGRTAELIVRPSRPILHRIRFRMRTLFALIFVVAAVCFTTQRWPHVVLFLSSLFAAVLVTRGTWRFHRGHTSTSTNRRRCLAAFGIVLASLLWLGCYVLSAAPASRMLYTLRAPDDVRVAIGLTFYRPFVWASRFPAFYRCEPVRWYFEAWEG